MSDWLYVAVGALTVLSITGAGLRWLVKTFLNELRPNHGSSLHDRIHRIEENQLEIRANQQRIHERIDAIWEHLVRK